MIQVYFCNFFEDLYKLLIFLTCKNKLINITYYKVHNNF